MVYRRIKDLREDTDTRQETLAEYLSIAQNTYSNYENGMRAMPIELYVKLAHFYGTSVDYLLGITDQKKPYPHENQHL